MPKVVRRGRICYICWCELRLIRLPSATEWPISSNQARKERGV